MIAESRAAVNEVSSASVGAFSGASLCSNETELYLFLTPRILRTDADSVTASRLAVERQP